MAGIGFGPLLSALGAGLGQGINDLQQQQYRQQQLAAQREAMQRENLYLQNYLRNQQMQQDTQLGAAAGAGFSLLGQDGGGAQPLPGVGPGLSGPAKTLLSPNPADRQVFSLPGTPAPLAGQPGNTPWSVGPTGVPMRLPSMGGGGVTFPFSPGETQSPSLNIGPGEPVEGAPPPPRGVPGVVGENQPVANRSQPGSGPTPSPPNIPPPSGGGGPFAPPQSGTSAPPRMDAPGAGGDENSGSLLQKAQYQGGTAAPLPPMSAYIAKALKLNPGASQTFIRSFAATAYKADQERRKEMMQETGQNRLLGNDAERIKMEKERLRLEEDRASKSGWDVLTDPTNGQQFRYNKTTGEARTLVGNQPYTPGGAQRVGTSSQAAPDPKTVDYTAKMISDYRMAPLSGWSLRSKFGQEVMSKVEQLNPQYDATKYAAKLRGAVAFTTGRQGDAVRSFSVSIDHLAVLDDAAAALANGDMQALNRLSNEIKKQFGYEGPVDFTFVKAVVGDEISKAIIGGVGSTTDRQQLQAGFDLANSPEQLVGVVEYAKRLMAGQLGGYRRQAGTAGFSQEDFEKALSPRAKQELESLPGGLETPAPGSDGGTTPPQPQGASPASQFQEGQTATNPQTGAKVIYRGGQWVPVQ